MSHHNCYYVINVSDPDNQTGNYPLEMNIIDFQEKKTLDRIKHVHNKIAPIKCCGLHMLIHRLAETL